MRDLNFGNGDDRAHHLGWVRTRLILEHEFQDAIRHGFSLIAAGFGSFSIFEGLTVGERNVSELPKAFALVLTAIGMIVILLAAGHFRQMNAWINADEFGTASAPVLPHERRPLLLAGAAVVIGVVSFVALLLLP
jgi:hypothetical protein